MSQLSQIFTNIANAIRNKTGSNELITPPEMATAIDNIPSGGSATAYAWVDNDSNVQYYNFNVAPSDISEYNTKKNIMIDINDCSVKVYQNNLPQEYTYERYSDDEFFTSSDDPKPIERTYTRDPTKDFTLW